MWSSFWNKPAEDVCAILDVGNGSVAGSLVRFRSGEKPEMIYSVRYPIHISEKPSSKHLMDRMTKLLDDVMRKLSHEGVQHLDYLKVRNKDVKHVFCIFSSPWYASKSKIVRIEKHEPTPVTEELIRDIVARERKSLTEAATAAGTGSVDFIEQKVVRAKLNGYETRHPYGQIARHLEFGIFMSMVPSQVIDKVESVISRYFNVKFVAFHSFALMSYNIIEDLFPAEENYAFMDITGEITEVVFVDRKNVADSLSFPHGKNGLLRAVANKFKVTPEIAVSYLKMYQKGAAGKELKGGIDAVITDVGLVWNKYFAKIMAEAAKGHTVPNKFFVTIDDDVAEIFIGFLTKPSTDAKGESIVPNVTVLSKNILSHFCSFGRGCQEDAFLAIESVYFNKMFHL